MVMAPQFPHAKPNSEWKRELAPAEFNALRKAGTETPGTGEYHKFFPQEGCVQPVARSWVGLSFGTHLPCRSADHVLRPPPQTLHAVHANFRSTPACPSSKTVVGMPLTNAIIRVTCATLASSWIWEVSRSSATAAARILGTCSMVRSTPNPTSVTESIASASSTSRMQRPQT